MRLCGRRAPVSGLAWGEPDRLNPGMTIIGYLKAEVGVGEWGRLTARAAHVAGIPFDSIVVTSTPSRQLHPYEVGSVDRYEFDTNVVAVNADQLPHVRSQLGEECFAGRYTIGQWAWELEEFPPSCAKSFALVDEVWAISDFTRTALEAVGDTPVYVCPPAIVPPAVDPAIGRDALGLPENRFVYLFSFDLFSDVERKNPLGLVEAFTSAFPKEEVDGPLLVLKAINGDQRPDDLEKIRSATRGRADVLVIDRYFDTKEQAAMMAAADCYVSLHRSEGFGLTMAEAMALGKPVIATGYSGNLEFMDDSTAYLVRWEYGEVPQGREPYRAGARWAEPDVSDAARLIRFVFEHQPEAIIKGENARRSVLARHGLSARAEFVRSRFDAVQALRARATGALPRVRDPASELPEFGGSALRALAAERPSPNSAARRLPALTTLYRRAVLRVLRHHDEHQGYVNSALAKAIEGLQRAIEERAGHSVAALMLERRLASLEERFDQLYASLPRSGPGDVEPAPRSREPIGDADAVPSPVEIMRVASELEHDVVVLRDQLGELRAIPSVADPTALLTKDDIGRPAIGYRTLDGSTDATSRATFSDLFRGSEDAVRERQRVYLDLLEGHGTVVDAGCGRGEMLDHLRSIGVDAIGVDVDRSMIERCRTKGHRAEMADILVYLRQQRDGTVGAIFGARIVEQLPAYELSAVLDEAYRVLRPGGLLVAELINPHSVAAFKTFWTDVNHRAPVFPEVVITFCRSAGFEEAMVRFPGGTGELEIDRWCEGYYAVVATKRPATGSENVG